MSIQNINTAANIPYRNLEKTSVNNSGSDASPSVAGDSFSASAREEMNFVPGELIVKFKGKAPQEMQTKGGFSAHIIKKFDMQATERTGSELCHVKLDSNTSVKAAIELLKSNENVAYAEPNYIMTIPMGEDGDVAPQPSCGQTSGDQQKLPNDLDPKLWGMNNTGQTSGKANADIDAPEAWNISTGKREGGPLIAVIDTGIDLDHPDLVNNLWKNNKEIAGDGIDNDGNGYVDDFDGYNFIGKNNNPDDDQGHGTHCAGTIGAQGNNGIGVAGVVWDANLMPLKAFNSKGQGNTVASIDAVLYATKMGADIISASWGGAGYSMALKDAIASFPGLFIAAAGNSALDNDTNPHYPSSYPSDNIIAVASTDHNDNLSSFSHYGKESVDVGAPGSSIYSTVPGGTYATKSGTSMATPHVSGVAALVMSKFPELSALEVKEAIMKSGDSIDALADKTVSGKRVNAHNALLVAQQMVDAKKLNS